MSVRPLKASIEPRSFKRGNVLAARLIVTSHDWLQLSHVHSNVETSFDLSAGRKRTPLQLSHVHSNVETSSSSRPRLTTDTLQLSHVHSNVETTAPTPRSAGARAGFN